MSECVAYLNGEWVDSDELRIDPRDRGFRTGDVVFDTAGTFDGVIFNTRLHAERLMRSLKYARIDSGLTTGEREAVMQEAVDAELVDVRRRLEKLYEALENSDLTLEVLSPRILTLRHREEQLTATREDAASQLEQRRVVLLTTDEIRGYVADFRGLLQEGTFPERKALIRNFVEGIRVEGDEATLTYTIPMPSDGVTSESASVLDFVQSGPPKGIRTEFQSWYL